MPTPVDYVRTKRSEAIEHLASKGYLARRRVYIGKATCEIAAGADEVWEVFETAIKNGLKDTYLSSKGCAGRCNLEPIVEVVEEGRKLVKYCRVTRERAQEIVKRHLVEGKTIREWTMC